MEVFPMSENDAPAGDPTPEEIRARCLAIIAEWTPAEEAARRLGIRANPHGKKSKAIRRVTAWTPPLIKRHPRT